MLQAMIGNFGAKHHLSKMDKVQHFKKIHEEYDSLFKDGLKKGKLPMRTTKHGFWGTASTFSVFEFFEKINLGKYNRFLDLGSGDGRVVLIASLFTDAVGVEGDEELVELSHEVRRKLDLNADFHHGDYMKHDFSEYDIIFIYPDKGFSEEFEEKLRKEFKGDLFVYNQIYVPYGLKKGKTHHIDQLPIIHYEMQ